MKEHLDPLFEVTQSKRPVHDTIYRAFFDGVCVISCYQYDRGVEMIGVRGDFSLGKGENHAVNLRHTQILDHQFEGSVEKKPLPFI